MGEGCVLDLAPPPRRVPYSLRLANLSAVPIGLIVLSILFIFVWVFTINVDLTGWYHFRGRTTKVDGEVVSSKRTGMRRGGSRHGGGFPIWEVRYRFETADGTAHEGVSYYAGSRKEARTVTVEYPAGKPQISRIMGMSRGYVGPLGLIPLFFLWGPLCLIIWGTGYYFKGVSLMRNGIVGKGRLISKKRIKSKEGKASEYRLTFVGHMS
jgi:hypothetical protein